MNTAKEYLDNLQGLILFMYVKRGKQVSLYDLMCLDPIVRQDIEAEFQLCRDEILSWHRQRDLRTLEYLKAGAERHLHTAVKPHISEEELHKQLLDYEGYINEIKATQLPSEFQETLHYHILKPLYDEIANAAEALGAGRPKVNVLLASLRTEQVNAAAIRITKSSEFIIAFESQLFSFLNRFTKIIVEALPRSESTNGMFSFSTLKKDVEEYVRANPVIQAMFADLILSYTVKGNVEEAQNFTPEYPNYIHGTHILSSMELFIMGHEYAHILKGHLVRVSGEKLELSNIDAEQIKKNWVQEFEADTLGLFFAIKALINRGFGEDFDLIGADLFFILREIVAKSFSIIKYGDENATNDSASHPPANARRENLRKAYLMSYNKEQLEKAEYFPKALEDVVYLLWEGIKPILYKHYETHKGKTIQA